MTLTKLAKDLRCSPNYIYLLEAGYKFPSLKFSIKIANKFQMNPRWIKTLWFRDYLLWTEARVGFRVGIGL
jgi:DNA-binding XRE family transcriptional regulator